MNRKSLFVIVILAVFSLTANAQETSHEQEKAENRPDWSIGTNVVDWLNFGTMNVEASVAVARHVTVNAKYKYNPWTFNSNNRDSQLQNRQNTIKAGIRWWPWHIYSGWWFCFNAQYQEYNRGGVIKRRAEEGDAFGLDVGAGYTLMLHKNFNLEFGVSGWGGYTAYTTYECTRCGKIIEGGNKWFLLPNEVIFGVVWIF